MRTAAGLFKAIRRMTGVAVLAAAATCVPTLAWAADAPVPNKGDTAWMLTCTVLVLLMTVPALGLFYGGLVRTKNMLSVLMQVFVGFSLITVLWCIYGYSLAFTAGNEVIGGLSRLFLAGTFDPVSGAFSTIGTFHHGVVLNELVYIAFQGTFAAITCCLILGALVERVKFSGMLLFLAFWFTFCYCPVAHMVWYVPGLDTHPGAHPVAGLLAGWGALDFAGGTVVHINAGVAGLVGAMILGRRIGLGREPMPPHSLTLTMIGASLLWFGWFGFNAGSALEADGSAALAFMNTYLATACAVLAWTGTEWMIKGKPSMLGAASGAVAGLVAITPAAGNVGIPGAFVIGLGAGPLCFWGVTGLKRMIRTDDALDVFGVHALGGVFGALATGIFSDPALGGAGGAAYPGIWAQLLIQAEAVGVVIAWTGLVAAAGFYLVKWTIGLRVSEDEEREGLDITVHGERAYDM
ncbi:MAG: ammonium transporter [Steroidobacteraceae bacterium]